MLIEGIVSFVNGLLGPTLQMLLRSMVGPVNLKIIR